MKISTSKPLKASHWMKETSYMTDKIEVLDKKIEADIVIIGGGFVGLWTAITIKEQAPDVKVAVIEQDVCGGGASGRNGGFVMSWWPKISSLQSFCTKEEALFLAKSAEKSIYELGDFCRTNNIDAHFLQKGWIWTATTKAHIDSWATTIAACENLGVRPFEVLSREDVMRRTGSPVHLAGVYEKSNATVQPALLVRGMRSVALSKGVEIFEKSPVTNIEPGSIVKVETVAGYIKAKQVVLATNAWATCINQISKLIVPVNSSIVVTDNIDAQLEKNGWTGGESITDSQLLVNYYRTTRDKRIAFGKGTGALSFGSKINDVFSYDEGSVELTKQDFRSNYPDLKDVKIQDAWSGPIDRTYDSLPIFGQLTGHENIHYGLGWSGNGVGVSRLGGRVLASLALGSNDKWSNCALINRKVRHFPPEPFRYIGGNLVRNAVIRKESKEMIGEKPYFVDVALAKFAPAGLEDKSN